MGINRAVFGSESSINNSEVPRGLKIDEIWYPLKKIEIMRKKLQGVHSSLIMIEELEETRHKEATYINVIKNAIMV